MTLVMRTKAKDEVLVARSAYKSVQSDILLSAHRSRCVTFPLILAFKPSEDSDYPWHPPYLGSFRCLHKDSLGPLPPFKHNNEYAV